MLYACTPDVFEFSELRHTGAQVNNNDVTLPRRRPMLRIYCNTSKGDGKCNFRAIIDSISEYSCRYRPTVIRDRPTVAQHLNKTEQQRHISELQK